MDKPGSPEQEPLSFGGSPEHCNQKANPFTAYGHLKTFPLHMAIRAHTYYWPPRKNGSCGPGNHVKLILVCPGKCRDTNGRYRARIRSVFIFTNSNEILVDHGNIAPADSLLRPPPGFTGYFLLTSMDFALSGYIGLWSQQLIVHP